MTAVNLIEAINEFERACHAFQVMPEFKSHEEEKAAVEATYGPPMEALGCWDRPLESIEEVREAIRLAFTHHALIDDIASEPLRAALIYLEKITGWKEPAGGEA